MTQRGPREDEGTVKPPSHVKVGPYRLRVELADMGPVGDEGDEMKDKGFGEYDPGTETLRLNERQRPNSLADTLLHEVVHAIFGYTGAQEALKSWDPWAEEYVVSALTGELLNVLRRNPLLVEYLCGEVPLPGQTRGRKPRKGARS